MRFYVRPQRSQNRAGSHLALAIALATSAVIATAGFAEPAYAAKKKGGGGDYSKEFIEAYKPLETAVNAEGADIAAATAQIPGLIAVSQSPAELMATGNLIYTAGTKSSNQKLQLQGMEMMLASGQVPVENQGQYNFVAYQLANSLSQYDKARQYAEAAIQHNFTTGDITPSMLRVVVAETYFSENRIPEGLDYLQKAINTRKANGQPVDQTWYTRGLGIAYREAVRPQVYQFVAEWVVDFPSITNWRDAVNIARNLEDYEPAEMLDLMRLGYTLDTFENKQAYIDYVEAADPRRLPKEVEKVIKQGYASGRVSKDDMFLADALKMATGRISADNAELPTLERDARSGNAGLRTVVAAGDTFLNYAEYAKAEEFYAKAAGMAGVDANLVNTRLGISQALQGKYAAAQTALAAVKGKREPLAMLWSAYARMKAAEAATPAAAVAATAS